MCIAGQIGDLPDFPGTGLTVLSPDHKYPRPYNPDPGTGSHLSPPSGPGGQNRQSLRLGSTGVPSRHAAASADFCSMIPYTIQDESKRIEREECLGVIFSGRSAAPLIPVPHRTA